MTEPFSPHRYSAENIEFDQQGNPFLEVTLAQIQLRLKLKNIGNQDNPVWIAWLDPSNEKTKEAGTKVLVEMLSQYPNSIAITPFSSKSGPMINQACQQSNIELVTLKGGVAKEELCKEVGEKGLTVDYKPITSAVDERCLGANLDQLEIIRQAIDHNKNILILDDVYSSGATVAAIIRLVELTTQGLIIHKELKNKIKIIVIAQEGQTTEEPANKNDEFFLFSQIFLPIVIGQLDHQQPEKTLD